MKKFEEVRLTFSSKNISVLKQAISDLCRDTMISNSSIIFEGCDMVITEEIREDFLFQFGMYYGRLLEKNKVI